MGAAKAELVGDHRPRGTLIAQFEDPRDLFGRYLRRAPVQRDMSVRGDRPRGVGAGDFGGFCRFEAVDW